MDNELDYDVCVVGGGPAGLAAAEMAAGAGARVLVADQKPSVGRKFLMAGKSGLNLTMAAPAGPFYGRVTGSDAMSEAFDSFGPAEVIAWTEGLGLKVFTGSSGRIFPASMKSSPLLRAWLLRLDGLGVARQTRWRWTGWEGAALRFETPAGPRLVSAGAVVLALGGGSWARLGSDGTWTGVLGDVSAPFGPSNCGFGVAWSPHMARSFGEPVKPVRLSLGDVSVQGEFVISARGIEGSGIYALAAATGRRMYAGPVTINLDLLPDVPLEKVLARLAKPQGKTSLTNHLRKTLGLTGARLALLREAGVPDDPAALARLLKAVPLHLTGPHPLDEAISTVGGVRLDAVDSDLMLTSRPGVFCVGEMLDWDAPTGGYLITTCLATGRWSGTAAARWAAGKKA